MWQYDQWTGGAISSVLQGGTGGNILGLTTLFPLGRKVGKLGYELLHPDAATKDGGLSLFANTKEGDEVTLMAGTKESLVDNVDRVTHYLDERAMFDQDEISGSLVIYCGGCSLALGDDVVRVPPAFNAVTMTSPFIGIFAFGEQGCFNKVDATTSCAAVNRHGNVSFRAK